MPSETASVFSVTGIPSSGPPSVPVTVPESTASGTSLITTGGLSVWVAAASEVATVKTRERFSAKYPGFIAQGGTASVTPSNSKRPSWSVSAANCPPIWTRAR